VSKQSKLSYVYQTFVSYVYCMTLLLNKILLHEVLSNKPSLMAESLAK